MKGTRPMKYNRKSDEIGVSKSADMKRRNQNPKNTTRGFSVEAFSRTKSNSNFYNPALIKKQKEFYKNAKLVNKFKKSIKRESQQSEFSKAGISEKNDKKTENTSDGNEMSKNIKNKGKKDKLEEEEKAKREREAQIMAKKEKREEAEARRKAIRENMMKKTRRGQPIMKYRIERLLESIQGSQSNS